MVGLLLMGFAWAGDGQLAVEAGPTGAVFAGQFETDGWAEGSFTYGVLMEPVSLGRAVRGLGPLPFPAPLGSLGIGHTMTTGLGASVVRVGLGYNVAAPMFTLLMVGPETQPAQVLAAGLEGDLKLLVPAFNENTRISFGVRPRALGTTVVRHLAPAPNASVMWTVLSPQIGIATVID